jgi:G3E family GTPase
VLINEFGEIGLDHHLLERIDDTMVLLQSGCLCCTIRSELSVAIKDVLSKRERGLVPPFRRLVIESTGLADPFPILSTLRADPVLTHHFCLGNVITTVDAVNGMSQLDGQHETVRQVVVADQLVVTKTELAPLWRAANQDLDVAALIATAGRPEGWLPTDVEPAHDHAAHRDPSRHDEDIRAVALAFDGALDWTMFGIWLTMLLNRHGNEVLRVKGMLNVAGTDKPVAVHGVQHLVHPPTHMSAWPDHERRSRLVLIVKGLDPAAIERSLRAFGLRPEPPDSVRAESATRDFQKAAEPKKR